MFKCLSPCLSSQAILLCENWMLTVRSGKITDWQRYAIQSPLCYLLAFSYWMVEFHLVTLTWFLKVNLYFITNLWIWRKEIIYRYSISLSSEKWFRLYTWSEHPLFSFNSSHTCMTRIPNISFWKKGAATHTLTLFIELWIAQLYDLFFHF